MKNFVVYKSSAGSGKTFTLVKEYLRLSLIDESRLTQNFKRILALTFTNKAAAEMKTRVVQTLFELSSIPETNKTGILLSKELNLSYDEIKYRSEIVLNSILHHYSDFSVGTIDSFTHKIIKTFAHDLQLPVNFNIELNVQDFYTKVIDKLFNSIGEDSYVSKLLIEYSLAKANDNKAWDPQAQIEEFSNLLQKENSEHFLNQLKHFNANELEGFRKEFVEFIKHYENTLILEGTNAIKLIHKNHLTHDDFYGKSRGPQILFYKCAESDFELSNISTKAVIEAAENNQWTNAKSSNSSKLDSILPNLSLALKNIIDFVSKHYSFYALCKILSKQMYPLMLLKKIEEISDEIKSEERLVFISEFNQKISEIIHEEPSPFIYERLGERYNHFLLDEFQDTSNLQWYNILPLLDNSLANGWSNLIVGDGKQSIYRWRNADVSQFASLPHLKNTPQSGHLQVIQESLIRNYREEFLSSNYRSLKTIIDFNNAVFSELSKALLTTENAKIYQNHEQNGKNEFEGYISVHGGKSEKEGVEEKNLQLILNHIQQAISSNFEYRDICVISRTNMHGNKIAHYLLENKIPVVSSDSLLLDKNQEVNVIIAYLKYISNQQDLISAAVIINYLFVSNQITETLYHSNLFQLHKGVSLFDLLKKLNIQLNKESIELNNLFDHCIHIIQALNLNETGNQYIRFFLDEMNEYLVLHSAASIPFFDWWEIRKKKSSLVIAESSNAVKIMTIHTSKGLEFPIVIVPFCNWPVYKSSETWVNLNSEFTSLPVSVIALTKKTEEIGFKFEYTSEIQDQILDNLNLIYVAFTRAVERLHIISYKSNTVKNECISDWIDKFISTHYHLEANYVLELGQKSQKVSQDKSPKSESFFLNPLSFSPSGSSIEIKASYTANTESVEKAKQEGIILHWLLSKITSHSDIDHAITAALIEGKIDPSQTNEIKSKLEEICNLEEIKYYFRPGVNCKIEADILQSDGSVLRPDRIVFEENETIIIDYKTGKLNDTVYFKQLSNYENALLALGYNTIKKMLVYVDESKIKILQ